MSQLDSYQFKIRAIEQEWKMHHTTYRTLDTVLNKYNQIQKYRAESLKELLPELDSIQFIFYKDFVAKLANYFDTLIYQSMHMINDIKQMLTRYNVQFQSVQKNLIELSKQIRKKKYDCTQSIILLQRNMGKNYPKVQIQAYNYNLSKFQEVNKNILLFRKTYHSDLIILAHDQIMRFFVLQLQRLRNNQFDLDQIVKKSKFEQKGKLVQLAEQIEWKKITSGILISKNSNICDLQILQQIVFNILKDKLSEQNLIFSLFNWITVDENMSKISNSLEHNNQQFEAGLRKLFNYFYGEQNKIILSNKSFKKIQEIVKIILQHSIENLKSQLLESLIIFMNGIKKQKVICRERQFLINQIITLYDEIKTHDYFKQEYWIGVQDYINIHFQGQQKQLKMEKFRKCVRKLGVSIIDHMKPKKRIFSKSNQNQNQQNKT